MSDEEEIAKLRQRLAELEAQKIQQAAETLPPSPKPASAKPPLGGLAVVIGLVVLLVVVGMRTHRSEPDSNTPPKSAAPAPSADNPASATPTAPPILKAENWRYSEDEDKLSGKKGKEACSVSTNEVELSFPYSSSHVQLCVRRDPRFGLDVYARLEGRGQVLCTSYLGCRLPVRYDEEAPTHVSGVGPSDNSTETVFLKPAAGVIARLKKSRHVVIGLNMYQAGQQSIEWDTEGLAWP